MKLADFNKAVTIAQSEVDLTGIDDSHLYGCAIPGFKPVVTTISAVSRLLAWQCREINGGWNNEEMNKIWACARYKFQVVGGDTTDIKNLAIALE